MQFIESLEPAYLPFSKDVSFTAHFRPCISNGSVNLQLTLYFTNHNEQSNGGCYYLDAVVYIYNFDCYDKPVATSANIKEQVLSKTPLKKALGLTYSAIVSNDSCDIIVRLEQAQLEWNIHNVVTVLKPQMPDLRIKAMYQDDTFKDVQFAVGQQSIMAHKNYLASCSKVFHSMFVHDTKEKQDGVVEIKDFNADVFENFIKYLYTFEIENMDGMAEELMLLADKYDIQCLKSQCENHLCQEMNVTDAIHFLFMAKKLNLSGLEQKALFIIKSDPEITESPDFSKLFGYSDFKEEFIQEVFTDTNAANDDIRKAVLGAIIAKLSL